MSAPAELTPATGVDADTPWIDGSALLNAASKQLGPGQLIAASDFTLLEGMNALEMFDPKMDAGLGASRALLFAELHAERRVPALTDLTGAQQLWLLDHMLAALVAFFDGHSLPQTVFTCVYCHLVPNALPAAASPVLRAALLSVVLLCDHACMLVERGQIWSDEDFALHHFGLPLPSQLRRQAAAARPPTSAPVFTTKSTLAELERAEKLLAEQTAARRASASAPAADTERAAPSDTESTSTSTSAPTSTSISTSASDAAEPVVPHGLTSEAVCHALMARACVQAAGGGL